MDAPFSAFEKTLPMTVANTGFMVDRLGRDCAPLQFLRELTQNAIEAVQASPDDTGEVIWDVDWDTFTLTGLYKLCVTDTGIGMSGEEMVRYINALSSSVHQQAHDGNFGVGAKIAAATRNHEGLVYLSWQGGSGAMVHLWRDPATGQYGLRQLERRGDRFDHWAPLDNAVRPDCIKTTGTKVVLYGMSEDHNTMQAPEGSPVPSAWISKYLNTRYFRFPEKVTVKVREGWDKPREDSDRNVLRTIRGQEWYLTEHSQSSGVVELTDARAHWWILKDEKAITQQSGKFASAGHVAALHDDELYEMGTGRAGVSRLQLFGVIFGHQRVVIYVEPTSSVDSNTARTNLLLGGEPLPWADWAAEFRASIPDAIKVLMEEVTAGSSSQDHRQAIRDRLKQISDLLKISRYRPAPKGVHLVDGTNLQGGHARRERDTEQKTSGRAGGSGGRAGSIYALFLAEEDGTPADLVNATPEPKVQWISTKEKTREPGDMEDRAARYLSEQNLLLINSDFRVFGDMVERWASQYADVPGAREPIENIVHEWFEQALIETVLSAHALHGPHWTPSDLQKLLNEEALTAAVLPRYHIDVAVKRAVGSKLGSLREKAS